MSVTADERVPAIRRGFVVDGVGEVDSVLPRVRALAIRVGPRRIRLIRFAEVASVDPEHGRVALRLPPARVGGGDPKGEQR